MGLNNSVEIDLDEGSSALGLGGEALVEEDSSIGKPRAEADVVDEDIDPNDRLPNHAVANVDGTVTLPLKFPKTLQIRKDGKVRTDTYSELKFHRLNGADQRAIAATSDETQAVVAFARSTRLSQAVMNALFDKMDMADITAGGQVLNSFLRTGRTTGKSSSAA